MKCARAELLISRQLDGDSLLESETLAMEQHLAACSCCRTVLSLETRRASMLDHALRGEGDRLEALERRIIESAKFSPGPARQRERAWWSLPVVYLRPAGTPVLVILLGLILGGGSYWSWTQWRPGGLPANGVLPTGTVATEDEEFDHVLFEESSSERSFFSSDRGQPLERDVTRSRFIILPYELNERPGNRFEDVMLDVERVDTRYIQLTNWR